MARRETLTAATTAATATAAVRSNPVALAGIAQERERERARAIERHRETHIYTHTDIHRNRYRHPAQTRTHGRKHTLEGASACVIVSRFRTPARKVCTVLHCVVGFVNQPWNDVRIFQMKVVVRTVNVGWDHRRVVPAVLVVVSAVLHINHTLGIPFDGEPHTQKTKKVPRVHE